MLDHSISFAELRWIAFESSTNENFTKGIASEENSQVNRISQNDHFPALNITLG